MRLSLLTSLVSFPLAVAAEPTILWQIDETFLAPESVCFDAETGIGFVSQLGEGGGKTKDGDGRISKITLDGKITALDWVVDLDAPKGMAIHDGWLWVSDIDELVAIEVATGKVIRRVAVENVEMLNDVAAGPDGEIYFTDFFGNQIFRLPKDGEPELLASGKELEMPNGVTVRDGKLYFASWGRSLADDFSTRTPGRVFSMTLPGKKIEAFTKEETGNLDGIEPLEGNGFLVTDWFAGKVYHLEEDGTARSILERGRGAADLEVVERDGRTLIFLPEMLENRLVCLALSGAKD